MNPIIVIGPLALIGTGIYLIVAAFREGVSTKARLKRSKKEAIRDAKKASKEYKKRVEKAIKDHRF